MPTTYCFNYSDVPMGIRSRNTAQQLPRDLSRTQGPSRPAGSCFSYSDVPVSIKSRDAAQQLPRDLSRTQGPSRPSSSCFSYSAGYMGYPCFSY